MTTSIRWSIEKGRESPNSASYNKPWVRGEGRGGEKEGRKGGEKEGRRGGKGGKERRGEGRRGGKGGKERRGEERRGGKGGKERRGEERRGGEGEGRSGEGEGRRGGEKEGRRGGEKEGRRGGEGERRRGEEEERRRGGEKEGRRGGGGRRGGYSRSTEIKSVVTYQRKVSVVLQHGPNTPINSSETLLSAFLHTLCFSHLLPCHRGQNMLLFFLRS